jgi:hypothetical protein
MSIFSSNSPSGAGPAGSGFRFFGFGGAVIPFTVVPGDTAPPRSSVALRLFDDGWPFDVGLPGPLAGVTGLVALLPVTGLVALLPVPCPLPARLPFVDVDLSFGTLGLVARFATTE